VISKRSEVSSLTDPAAAGGRANLKLDGVLPKSEIRNPKREKDRSSKYQK
jgi:hypothetical protein